MSTRFPIENEGFVMDRAMVGSGASSSGMGIREGLSGLSLIELSTLLKFISLVLELLEYNDDVEEDFS
eukprot:CAMPEP_0172204356 /NCGR_PEP_ID=MMETSP1050-20130122/31896_1 /TAXON_ID=233186 /ORGANISM="Cryptomonas curvata, Strain CCAP979/52" /LENGTH=67 /DNA_ID=CAMNT_0012882877 /DNA_START=76 /DNA_END=275 /DNA_ORIENTATION=-